MLQHDDCRITRHDKYLNRANSGRVVSCCILRIKVDAPDRPSCDHDRHRTTTTVNCQFSHVGSSTMPGPLSLFSVNAVLVMSADDGSRIFTKYYSPPHPPAGAAPNATDYPGANPYQTVKEQKSFESGLLDKTNKQTSDVILYDNRNVVFKVESDVMLYVVGAADENEILLYNVLLSLRDALGILFKYVIFIGVSILQFPTPATSLYWIPS